MGVNSIFRSIVMTRKLPINLLLGLIFFLMCCSTGALALSAAVFSKSYVQTAEVRNWGSIARSDWLGIQTTGGIFNEGGALFSDGDLFIETGGTLTNQAAVAFVNNQGDLAATLEQLGSDASLQAVLSSMLTAGLSAQITEMAGLGADLPKDAPFTQRITQDIQQGIVESTVEAGVTSAVYGEDFGDAFVTSLRSKAAETLGEHFAQGIGSAVEDGKMDTAGQMIAHAALGCAMGSIASDDCASGAAGAVIGETVGLLYAENIKEWAHKARNGTLNKDEVFTQLQKMKKDGVDIAKLASGFAVALGGGDVNLAAMTGGNAAENNALELVLMYLIYAENPRAEGSPWKLWIDIGEGKDPISQMMEKGTTAAVEWSASEFPEETEAVLNVLETIGTKIDAVITYVDEATGKTISKNWNELDTDVQYSLKGLGKVTSIFLPLSSVKYFKSLKDKWRPSNKLDIPENSTLKKPVVIGENMKDRVIPTAEDLDAGYYKPRNTSGDPLKKNERWIDDKMREGREIIDVGPDPMREDRSKFYEAEKKRIETKGYPVTNKDIDE